MSDTEEDEEVSGLAAMIDWQKLAKFGENIGYNTLYLFILSILSVNVLFYTKKTVIPNDLKDLFPIDPVNWPYCYTDGSQYAPCPEAPESEGQEPPEPKCAKMKFGNIYEGIKDKDPDNEYGREMLINASIFLEKLVFKAFCLTDEQNRMINEIAQEDEKATLLNGQFIIGRAKQWVNNTTVFHFTKTRFLLVKILDFIRNVKIPSELSDYIEPFMFIVGMGVFMLLILYFVLGLPFVFTVVGMLLNKSQDKNVKTWGGGIIWTLFTGGGFGLIPLIISIVQSIQFIGSFVLFPLTNPVQYRDLYAKYVPIIFFFLIVMFIAEAFDTFDEDIALVILFTLLTISSYFLWPTITGIKNGIVQYTERTKREKAAADAKSNSNANNARK